MIKDNIVKCLKKTTLELLIDLLEKDEKRDEREENDQDKEKGRKVNSFGSAEKISFKNDPDSFYIYFQNLHNLSLNEAMNIKLQFSDLVKTENSGLIVCKLKISITSSYGENGELTLDLGSINLTDENSRLNNNFLKTNRIWEKTGYFEDTTNVEFYLRLVTESENYLEETQINELRSLNITNKDIMHSFNDEEIKKVTDYIDNSGTFFLKTTPSTYSDNIYSDVNGWKPLGHLCRKNRNECDGNLKCSCMKKHFFLNTCVTQQTYENDCVY